MLYSLITIKSKLQGVLYSLMNIKSKLLLKNSHHIKVMYVLLYLFHDVVYW